MKTFHQFLKENTNTIKLVSQKIPQDLLNDADNDKELSGYVHPENESLNRLAIIHNNEMVGFMTPRKEGEFYRTGAIYIKPEHRSKGLGTAAIKEFFKDKQGKTLISDKNPASLKAYLNAGFQHTGKSIKDGDDTLHVLIKS